MRVFSTVPQDDLNRVGAAARESEAAEYDGIVTMEGRHNPFLPLALAAAATERVELVSGVAIAFARSSMMVASVGWDLLVASRGRFVMGLGSQVRAHNEHRFAVPWSAPAPRMREYVQALRAIWRCWNYGEKLDYRGKHYRFGLMTPSFAPEHTDYALPALLRVAGEVCDGVRLHPFFTRRYMENVVIQRLKEGWARSGRDRTRFEIAGGGFITTGADDAAVAEAVERVRQRIGFYGSTHAYWPVWEQHCLEDLGHRLFSMSMNGEWDRMPSAVPDEVVALFAAIGRHDEIVARIEGHFGGISDALSAGITPGTESDLPADLIQDVQRIPGRFTGFEPEAAA